ncbi:MAG: amidohydrolase family protein [Candidatus Latescibacteria bacterium]|nr:amidohydrolase family protein [Candidatus Latescibacterota bacterium]
MLISTRKSTACLRASTLLLLVLAGCAANNVDLILTDATVLNVQSGQVHPDRHIVIDDGVIVAIEKSGQPLPSSDRVIAAGGRLLTPGLIDVHHHTAYLLSDSITAGGGFITRLSMAPDSIQAYRSTFAQAYLPYGVTAVRDAGSSEKNMAMLLAWTKPSPSSPDFYPVGGAIVSHEEGRPPYEGHTVVANPEEAAQKVRHYHDLGIRHIKLYWRLRQAEFQAALAQARALDLRVTGHIDFKVFSLAAALDEGLTSFEHAYTVGVGAMTDQEYRDCWSIHVNQHFGDRPGGRFFLGALEYFNYLGDEHPKMLALIDRLSAVEGTVAPTLHIFAQRLGLTYFTTPSLGTFDQTADLPDPMKVRAAAGYQRLARYVRQMHKAGVRLTIGTDWRDPGKAVLSEMMLLQESGIPMRDVFRIATWNGAQAIGIEQDVGSIEVGKRANLVLFSGNPLQNPRHLLGQRLVIKGGVVWQDPASK